MATPQRTTGLTYADLCEMFPEEDLVQRDLIDGELFVTASPVRRHQRAVIALGSALFTYTSAHGGEVYSSPMDVFFSDTDVVEPDVVFLRAETADRLEDPRYVDVTPDLVIEVSSPGTRTIDLTRKRDLYERFSVHEYWFVDLDTDEIHVRRLADGRYQEPVAVGRGGVIESPLLPGLRILADDVLGHAE